MDLLIKNMEMPTEGTLRLIIFPNGRVDEINIYNEACMSTDAQAVALPEHGRLIEENKAYDSIMEQTANHYIDMDGVDLGLQNAPTVLEASNGTDN